MNLVEFMKAQIKAIEEARWFEGIRIGHDPRDDNFDRKWVIHNAKKFRETYNK